MSTPASASVLTTGLSTINTSGAVPCCAANNTLLVKSVVSNPVRFTVTPADVPHFCNNCTHEELLSYCGYGSQMVYVPEPADEPPDDDEAEEEHADRPPATAASASAVNTTTRRCGAVLEDMMVSPSAVCRRCGCEATWNDYQAGRAHHRIDCSNRFDRT